MFERSRKRSTTLSLVFAIVFMVALAVCAVFLPELTKSFLRLKTSFVGFSFWYSLVNGYIVLALAAVADILLIKLLGNIKKGEVFVNQNVTILRFISWTIMLAALPFVALGLYFRVAYAVGGVALFVGICLRVVKNAFAEAVAIKDENDYTV
jgi:hypothetical protein